jgi:perosamine synthetase
VRAVSEVLRSGWLTTGARARAFEDAFRSEVGARHALAVSSGTAALHLALRLFEVGPGDEVLVPTTTFASTANVVEHVGARPVFCDIDPVTLNIDARAMARRVTERTRAIIPVHLGGYPCDMDAILEVAEQHDLKVLEDSAHAIETELGGRRAGTMGDAGAFSFYATKTLTTGEGGMLTFAADAWTADARALSLHGLSRDAWRRYTKDGGLTYDVLVPGYKYNLPDVLAAIGLVQIGKLRARYLERRALVLAYTAALESLPLCWQPVDPPGGRHAHHLFMVVLEEGIDRDALAARLKERQIGTSLHFKPLHLQSYYAERYGHCQGDFPVAESVFSRCLSLPLYPDMTTTDVDYVAGHVRALIG